MPTSEGAVLYNSGVVAAIWLGAILSMVGFKRPSALRISVSFSAAIFISAALLHMIPEGVKLAGETAGLFILLGYLAFYFMERFVMVHPCEETGCDYHHVGTAAFIGLSLHSFMNGFTLGSALLVPGLGLAVFLAILVHKAPEAFSLASVLRVGGQPRRKILAYIAFYSLLFPLGSAVAFFGLGTLSEKVIGAVVAFTAGSFIQIATGDLMPDTHHESDERWKALSAFLLGVALMVAAHFFLEI